MSSEPRRGPSEDSFIEVLRSEVRAGTENLGAWLNHVVAAGRAELLVELEARLRGLEAYFELRHLPLAPEERSRLVTRSFAAELRVAGAGLELAVAAANRVVAVGFPEIRQFEALLKNQMRRQTNLDYHVGKILEQPTPLDSLTRLLEELDDLGILLAGLGEEAATCQAFLSLGRSYRRGLKECRYIDMLLSQRFKAQLDRVDNVVLAAVVRGISGRAREAVVVALLYLHRCLRYLRLVEHDLEADRPLRHHLVLFALLDREIDDLSRWIQSKLVKGRLDERAAAAVELVVHLLRGEARRVRGRELAGVAAERAAPPIQAKIRRSHDLLRNCFETSIVALAAAFDPAAAPIPARTPRAAEARKLQQDLWGLRAYLIGALDRKEELDPALFVLRLEEFRQHPLRYLMYRQWGEFEGLSGPVITAASPSASRALVWKFIRFLEHLIGEVSDLPDSGREAPLGRVR